MSNPGKVSIEVSEDALAGWGMAKPTPMTELPSGVSVQVRTLDIPLMVELDILDKMDSFTPKVLETKSGKKKTEDPKMTPEKLLGLVEILDKITVACVIQPKISALPEDGVREEGVRYVDKVSIGDKMEIFQASFKGMEELFRLGGEQAAPVGDLETL